MVSYVLHHVPLLNYWKSLACRLRRAKVCIDPFISSFEGPMVLELDKSVLDKWNKKCVTGCCLTERQN
jgi:hypothetical protein